MQGFQEQKSAIQKELKKIANYSKTASTLLEDLEDFDDETDRSSITNITASISKKVNRIEGIVTGSLHLDDLSFNITRGASISPLKNRDAIIFGGLGSLLDSEENDRDTTVSSEKLREELSQLRQKTLQLELKNQELRTIIENLKTDIDNLSKKNSSLNSQLKKMEDVNESVAQTLLQKDMMIREYNKLLEKKDLELGSQNSLEESVKSLRDQVYRLKDLGEQRKPKSLEGLECHVDCREKMSEFLKGKEYCVVDFKGGNSGCFLVVQNGYGMVLFVGNEEVYTSKLKDCE